MAVAGHPLPRLRLQRLQLGLIVGRADVLDLPRPRRDEYITCTAVAPDLVFTVLTYGTSQLYGPSVVRKSEFAKPETRRSA